MIVLHIHHQAISIKNVLQFHSEYRSNSVTIERAQITQVQQFLLRILHPDGLISLSFKQLVSLLVLPLVCLPQNKRGYDLVPAPQIARLTPKPV